MNFQILANNFSIVKQEKLDGEEETKLAAASEKTGPDYERRTKPSQISAQEMFSTEGDIIFVQVKRVINRI